MSKQSFQKHFGVGFRRIKDALGPHYGEWHGTWYIYVHNDYVSVESPEKIKLTQYHTGAIAIGSTDQHPPISKFKGVLNHAVHLAESVPKKKLTENRLSRIERLQQELDELRGKGGGDEKRTA